jgi:hypothetical protein
MNREGSHIPTTVVRVLPVLVLRNTKMDTMVESTNTMRRVKSRRVQCMLYVSRKCTTMLARMVKITRLYRMVRDT